MANKVRCINCDLPMGNSVSTYAGEPFDGLRRSLAPTNILELPCHERCQPNPILSGVFQERCEAVLRVLGEKGTLWDWVWEDAVVKILMMDRPETKTMSVIRMKGLESIYERNTLGVCHHFAVFHKWVLPHLAKLELMVREINHVSHGNVADKYKIREAFIGRSFVSVYRFQGWKEFVAVDVGSVRIQAFRHWETALAYVQKWNLSPDDRAKYFFAQMQEEK